MTFLAPAAGLIAAAIAIPGLVFFYLLKLRRRPMRVSSTLLWQKATHDLQVNAPLRWPKLTWLFLLQLLALLAFLFALARPAIDGGGPDASRIVLIIDRSASMSATDGRDPRTGVVNNTTRLEEAKARAEETISRLRYAGGARGARAMVVALAADARAITAFTDSTSALRDAVRAITPSDQPADLHAALRVLSSLGAGQVDEQSMRERTAVYIYSDGAYQPPAAGGPFSAPGLGSMDIRLIPVGPPPIPAEGGTGAHAPPVDNLGIVAISARRDHEDPVIARIFVRVQNASAEPSRTTLQLRIAGQLVDTRAIDIPARTVTPAGRVEPGQSAATFELNRPTGGLVVISLTRLDALESDNTAAIVLGEPSRPEVLLVARDARPDPFLAGVLEVLDLGRLIVTDATGYETRARIGGMSIQDGLGGFDLILFDRTQPATLPSLPTMSIGAGLPIPGLSVSPLPSEPSTNTTANFLAWRRTHPILRYVSLDPVVIDPPMILSLPPEAGGALPQPPAPPPGEPQAPPAPAIRPITASISLAEGPFGPILGLVEQGAVRRIIIAFELARSTWGPDVSFPVFMANAIEHLTLRSEAGGGAGRSYRTADPITVTPAPGAASLTITGPLRATVDILDAAEAERTREIPIGVLERVGVYTVAGALQSQATLAVNLADATESALATAQMLDIAGGGSARSPLDAPADAGPREIWHWFVLLGLLLASVEWLIYAWRMRP